jgi:hypothetical protein
MRAIDHNRHGYVMESMISYNMLEFDIAIGRREKSSRSGIEEEKNKWGNERECEN